MLLLISRVVLGGVMPKNELVVCIVFAVLLFMGLFRGPMTLVGCGAATLRRFVQRSFLLRSVLIRSIRYSYHYREYRKLHYPVLGCMGSCLYEG